MCGELKDRTIRRTLPVQDKSGTEKSGGKVTEACSCDVLHELGP